MARPKKTFKLKRIIEGMNNENRKDKRALENISSLPDLKIVYENMKPGKNNVSGININSLIIYILFYKYIAQII